MAETLVKINQNIIPLFKINTLAKVFGWTNEAIRKKEERGVIPEAKFRSVNGDRLYSVEEIALFEYIFREIWPHRQGKKTPEWLKNLIEDSFNLVRNEVMINGKVSSGSSFNSIHFKYSDNGFSKYRAMLYIEHWREVLLGVGPEDEEDFWEE